MEEIFKESLADSVSALSESEKVTFRKVLSSRYRIEQELGQGGMSIVYKCTDLAMNRTVAIKCLQPRLAEQPKNIVRIQQEAKAIARLDHPNIVRVHHFDDNAGVPYIVMDYVHGCSLAHVLEKDGAMNCKRAIKLMAQVMDALSHAHTQGVVHRDLKPSNVIIVDDGAVEESVKILDFGIARVAGDSEMRLTQTGEIFGSPLYMSPEQCHGGRADESSDQYACGVMLFECLTGQTPFIGETAMSILLKQISETPPSLKEGSLGRQFDPRLESVVARLLKKGRDERYPSMSAARTALLETLSEPVARSMPVAVKKKAPISATALVLLAIGSIAIGGILYAINSEPPPLTIPPEKAHSIMDEVDDDAGDPAVKRLLSIQDHRNERVFDTEAGELPRFKKLTGKSIPLIAQMPNLEGANLTCCGLLRAADLKPLTRAPRLQSLSVSATPVGDEACPIIARMTNLTGLDMSDAAITSKGLEQLSRTRLKRLFVRKNQLENDCFDVIGKMHSLEELDLSENARLSSGLEKLDRLTNLDTLGLYDTAIGDAQIKDILKFKRLRALFIGNTNVTEAGLRQLENLRNLRTLHLDQLNLSERALHQFLSKMPQIHELSISEIKLRTQELQELRHDFPNLDLRTFPPAPLELFNKYNSRIPTKRS